MSAADLVILVPAVVLWALVVYRLPTLRLPGPPRALWVALLALACTGTVHIPDVRAQLQAGTGVAGVAVVTQVLTLAAAAAVLVVLRAIAGVTSGRKRLAVVSVVAAVTMAGPLVAARPTAFVGELSGHPLQGPTETTWAWVAHWTATLGYLGWALVNAVALCARSSRQAAPSPLRTGLRVIGAGCAVALAHVLTKALIIAASFLGVGREFTGASMTLQIAQQAAALLVITVGCGYQRLHQGGCRAADTVGALRSLLRLRRLWVTLYSAVPYIALSPGVTSLVGLPLNPRDRLYRRVMEIRDGLLALGPYADRDVRAQALAEARGAGRGERQAAAVAEAVWLSVAVRAKTLGAPPTRGTPVRAAPGGADLGEEVRWLELVAAAYSRCPLTARLVALHSCPTPSPERA